MSSPNQDFGEPFSNEVAPNDLGPVITIDPVLIGVFVIVAVIFIMVAIFAVMLGKQRGNKAIIESRDNSAKAIYDHINYALHEALIAQGVARIDKARDLKNVLETRLGPLMAFNEKHLKAFKALKKALSPASEVKKDDAPPKPPEIKVAVGADQLSLEIWSALQKFKSVWSDRARIIALIGAAQDEMLRDPKPRAIDTKQKLKIGSQPVTTVKKEVSQKSTDTSMTDTPPEEPPPSPPPSSGRKVKKLPAHKKNMLA